MDRPSKVEALAFVNGLRDVFLALVHANHPAIARYDALFAPLVDELASLDELADEVAAVDRDLAADLAPPADPPGLSSGSAPGGSGFPEGHEGAVP